MRGGKSGSLKGKNKWVRTESGPNSAPIQPNPPPKPKPAADAGREQQPALKKVGKFALARDPAPKPTAAAPPASLNRDRVTYERPKDSAAAAAPPLALPATTRAQTAVQKAGKVKSIVRPGKQRWNTYVRQSIGGGETEKQSASTAAAGPPLSSAPAPAAAATATPLSAAELQLRKRSKRISAASELVRKHQGRKTAQPSTQHAMQLLRLGGQLYSRGGPKGKGRSLKLQYNGDTVSNITMNRSAVKTKPKPSTSAPTPAIAIASSSRTNLLSTRSASRQLATQKQQNANTLKHKKPMSRLKGGRLVYCPVYCHTGRCPRRGRGCPLRHDPTKRAVCPLWLRGKCALGAACPLQHQRRPELMPMCVHYLQGRCTNTQCPYLHVDLPADAPQCAAFLRGYCAAGVKCASKHYTLKQIKEERKLVAGKEGGGVKKKRDPKKQRSSSSGGDTDGKPMKRKRRRGRYFDQLPVDEEEKLEKLGEDDESSDSDGEGDGEEKQPVTSAASSEESRDANSDAEAIEKEHGKGETSEDQEEEDQPPKKQPRRLTEAPLPDFIGF
ncbi:hypothetical protein Ndes2526B_g02635 [Nannochloris sp. 'desiccata']